MRSEDALKLLKNGVLKKGCKVKMSSLKGFEKFTEIEDAYIERARIDELEDDWIVVIINGERYDSSWIDEVEVDLCEKLECHSCEEGKCVSGG